MKTVCLMFIVALISVVSGDAPKATTTTGLDCSGNALVCDFESECCGDAVVDFSIQRNHWHQSIKVCYFKDMNSIQLGATVFSF